MINMPPILSEDENSYSEDEIPAKEPVVDEEEDNSEDEENEDGPEEEYVVEKIMSHAFEPDGTVKYEVKWHGYEKKSDRTWEPEENLATAQDTLNDYFKSIGGRPVFPEPKQKKERKRKVSEPASTPVSGRGRKKAKSEDAALPVASHRRSKNGELPAGSWEDLVTSIETVEELQDPTTGNVERHAYLTWNDGKKSHHKLVVVNQKCPQKMLSYYEQHLVFKTHEVNAPDAEDSS